MLQLSLGLRHARRDNRTLTFCEVKTRLQHQDRAAASSCQQIRRAIYTTWGQGKLRNHPSEGNYKKNTPPFPGQDGSRNLWQPPCMKDFFCPILFFYQQTSEGQLTATQRATGSVPTCSKHIWGSPSVGVSTCDVAALTQGVQAHANSYDWKNPLASYTELLKGTDVMNVN